MMDYKALYEAEKARMDKLLTYISIELKDMLELIDLDMSVPRYQIESLSKRVAEEING